MIHTIPHKDPKQNKEKPADKVNPRLAAALTLSDFYTVQRKNGESNE